MDGFTYSTICVQKKKKKKKGAKLRVELKLNHRAKNKRGQKLKRKAHMGLGHPLQKLYNLCGSKLVFKWEMSTSKGYMLAPQKKKKKKKHFKNHPILVVLEYGHEADKGRVG
jgi:hypothetical protein